MVEAPMPHLASHQTFQSSSSQELQILEGGDYIGLTKRPHRFLESLLPLKVGNTCTQLTGVQ